MTLDNFHILSVSLVLFRCESSHDNILVTDFVEAKECGLLLRRRRKDLFLLLRIGCSLRACCLLFRLLGLRLGFTIPGGSVLRSSSSDRLTLFLSLTFGFSGRC